MRRSVIALGLAALSHGARSVCVAAPVSATSALRAVAASSVALPARMRAGAVPLVQRRLAHDSALADATRRELEEEMGRSGKPEEPMPPAGWRVKRTAGKTTFELHKNYEDEEIAVHYCPKEDSGEMNAHEILVLVTRAGQSLQVDLSVEEGELVLDNICFYKDAALAKDESAEADAKRLQLYPGPALSELDDGLVDGFVKYLEKRGVNEELGEFVTLYSFWAEQQEYEHWLSSINSFVS